MRTKILQTKLKGLLEIFEYPLTTIRSNPQTYQLEGVQNLTKIIGTLEELKLFRPLLKDLRTLSFYRSNLDLLVIPTGERNIIVNNVPLLKVQVKNLVDALDLSVAPNLEQAISIKIPNPYSFDDLRKVSDKLDKVFSQTLLHEDIGGTVEIANFDSGSYWIDIIVGNKEAIALVGGLAYSAAVIFKNITEGIHTIKKIREIGSSKEATDEVSAKLKEKQNSLTELEAKYIYDKYYRGGNHEQEGRVKLALSELAELFTQGAEVHPPLNASNEVKEAFPDMRKIETLETRIAKLERTTKSNKKQK